MSRDTRSGASGDMMSIGLEDGLDRYDAAEARALRSLHRTGLSLRAEPPRMSGGQAYDGRIPLNLPALSPTEIGEYYALHVSYTDYTTSQAVLARAEMLSSKEKLDLVLAAVRKSKVGTVQEKGDLTTLDIRYVEANANYIEAKTYYELLATISEGAARDIKFISRIIETKRMEMEMGFRGGSIERVPREHPGAERFRRRDRSGGT